LLATAISAYLRRGAGYERLQVAPFLATFTPGNDHPMRNYAIPDDGATPSRSEIDGLVDIYRSRGLTPRLEYPTGAAPDLEPALLAYGFVIDGRLPLLTMTPDQQPQAMAVPGVVVGTAETDEDHADALVVADLAYGGEGRQPAAGLIEARRAMVGSGGAVVLARSADGRPVGSGLYPVPQEGVTEIAAVGVLPAYRDRGVATAVITALARSALAAGVELVWLTAENDPEARAARTAGFRLEGDEMLHISLPFSGS